MPANIHSWGESLSNLARPSVANHSIRYSRTIAGDTTSVEGSASSGPIGQEFATDIGVDIAIKRRTFRFETSLTGTLGEPRIGDVIRDLADDTDWRIVPQGDNYAWKWFDQNKTTYLVTTEQD